MEQQTHARHDESSNQRRTRMLRELVAYGFEAGIFLETIKLGAAIAAGALITLWLTGQSPSVAGVTGSLDSETAPFVQPVVDSPLEFTPAAAPAMPDTPQRDVHSDSQVPSAR